MKKNGESTSAMSIAIAIISIIACVAVIVLSILQIFNIWIYANNVAIPLLGLIVLCQAYLQWNKSRKIAYFNLGTAAFIFICAIIVFFVK